MYATEYAKQSGHSYNLILRLLGEGKIPAIKGFKYDIDPDEADAAIAALKIAPKRAPRRKEANKAAQEAPPVKRVSKPVKFNFRERLDQLKKR